MNVNLAIQCANLKTPSFQRTLESSPSFRNVTVDWVRSHGKQNRLSGLAGAMHASRIPCRTLRWDDVL